MSALLVKMKKSVSALLTIAAPNFYERLCYRKKYGERMNLRNPVSFSEKLLWLRHNTYCGDKTIMKLEDKLEVREYLTQMGFSHLLTKLYFSTDDPDSISVGALPERFALKRSSGCDTNLICQDKSDLSERELRKIISHWKHGQLSFDIITSRISGVKLRELPIHYLCEELLEGTPSDYKFYCFNGVPKAILYIENRFGDSGIAGCFMSPSWDFVANLNDHYRKLDSLPAKPKGLSEMLEIAKTLSSPYPFVRVDLYNINGRIVFGELTFFPNGCIGMSETPIDGIPMGNLLTLPFEKE